MRTCVGWPKAYASAAVATVLMRALIETTAATAQTALPSVTITESRPSPKPRAKTKMPTAKTAAIRRESIQRTAKADRSGSPVAQTTGATDQGASQASDNLVTPAVAAARAGETQSADTRARILTKGAGTTYTLGKEDIDARPQGNNTNFDRVVLQVPGVSQDSAASGDFHIRNEHANVQYRINGILLPDGVSGFSQVLDTSFVQTLSLIDGALPAEYGLHTAGIIDIQTRNGADAPGGSIGIYGGSHGTIIPTIDDAGTIGRWDYFFTGRYVTNKLGIENPTPTDNAIHDQTRQGRYFAYVSGLLEDGTRLTFMSGATIAAYQIPNTPGLPTAFTAFGVGDFDSRC